MVDCKKQGGNTPSRVFKRISKVPDTVLHLSVFNSYRLLSRLVIIANLNKLESYFYLQNSSFNRLISDQKCNNAYFDDY